MHRSCICHIIVELAIILELLNSFVTMTAQETITCDDSPCDSGKYYNGSCCLPCTNGTFNKHAVHRNASCQHHSYEKDCVLIKKGDAKSNNKWDCSFLTQSTEPSVTGYNSTTITKHQFQGEPTVQTLVLVIIIIAAVIFVLIILFIIYCIWRQGRNNGRELTEASDPFMMKKLDSLT